MSTLPMPVPAVVVPAVLAVLDLPTLALPARVLESALWNCCQGAPYAVALWDGRPTLNVMCVSCACVWQRQHGDASPVIALVKA